MRLWPRAVPRPIRFHDLRHSAATLMLRAGVDPHRVQRILRHSDVRTTTGVYGHLLVEDLRSAINSIAPSAMLPEPPDTHANERKIASRRDSVCCISAAWTGKALTRTSRR